MESVKKIDSKHHSDPKRSEAHGLYIIISMAILGLLTIFVETMLVPALPHVAEDLSVSSADLAWVLISYTLAGAVAIPIVGKMGEMYGRKRILLSIMVVYMLGLVGAALSWDLLSLVAFRALQGVGMGAVPLLMGMAKDLLPGHLVPSGIGLISAMIGVGAALGMVVGGLLVSFVGWNNAFWAVLPVVILLLGIVHRSVPDTQIKHPAKMDLVGALLLGLGLLALLLALSQGSLWGWTSTVTLGLFIGALALFAAFVRRERTYSEPIVRLDLLKNRNISTAYMIMFFIGAIMFMLYQTLPYFLGMPREAGGFGVTSQIVIGLFLLPNAITQLISSPIGGKQGQRIGHGKVLIIGLAVAAAGLVALALFHGSEAGVLLTVTVFGFGIGLAQVGNTNLLASACTRSTFGSATAVNTMILTIGMSTGPVIASLIIGGFADASNGYAYCWATAAVLAVLAIGLVIMNKADLGAETISASPREERS